MNSLNHFINLKQSHFNYNRIDDLQDLEYSLSTIIGEIINFDIYPDYISQSEYVNICNNILNTEINLLPDEIYPDIKYITFKKGKNKTGKIKFKCNGENEEIDITFKKVKKVYHLHLYNQKYNIDQVINPCHHQYPPGVFIFEVYNKLDNMIDALNSGDCITAAIERLITKNVIDLTPTDKQYFSDIKSLGLYLNDYIDLNTDTSTCNYIDACIDFFNNYYDEYINFARIQCDKNNED